jgi:hypothetical protein
MNTYLKTFVLLTILTVIILSAVTVYKYQNTSNDPGVIPAESPLAVDIVQQAISATVVADKTLTSGTVVIEVNDFMNDGVTFEDPANPGDYILSSHIGYCLENGFCPDEYSSKYFTIWFDAKDSVFFVQLLEQPIATARREAELYLSNVLNITPKELCGLEYYMSVLKNVDERFAGQHLQFSLCSGSQNLY